MYTARARGGSARGLRHDVRYGTQNDSADVKMAGITRWWAEPDTHGDGDGELCVVPRPPWSP